MKQMTNKLVSLFPKRKSVGKLRKMKHKKILLGIPIAFLSFEVFSGIILGYFAGKFSGGKMPGVQGRLKSLTFNIRSHRIHLHHWVWASALLPVVVTHNFLPTPVLLTSGFLGGLIVQGVSCYDDWHRVLTKRKKL